MFVEWFIDEITQMSSTQDIDKLKRMIDSEREKVESNIKKNFPDYIFRATMLQIPVGDNVTPTTLMVALENNI